MLTTREIIKTLYNALIQRLKKHRGNWEQNDPTADDYIKNRPFYIDENKVIEIIPKQTAVFNSEGEPASAIGVAIISLSPIIKLVVGQEYDVVWDGMKYKCIAYESNGLAVIGSNFFANNSFDDEPFFIAINKEMLGGAYIATGDINSHVIEVTTKDIKKLDKKYLPDFAPVATSGSYNDLTDTPTLATVATSGNYNDLTNKPIIYTDMIRYNVSQSLNTAQKNVARNNIGAVGYEAQTLTDGQKAQARTNIGAGTSSFSGSYNDLTNKPTFATVATSGDYGDLTGTPDIVQADYAVNDDRQPSFVCNRPCYDGEQIRKLSVEFSLALNDEKKQDINNGAYYNFKATTTNNPDSLHTFVIDKLSYTGGPIIVNAKNTSTNSYYKIMLYGNANLLTNYILTKGIGSNTTILTETNDTGENFAIGFFASRNIIFLIGTEFDLKINNTDIIERFNELKQLDERYVPSTIQRTGDPLYLTDSTGTQHEITIEDSGKFPVSLIPNVVEVDNTLSIEGKAADAKAVGDAVAQLTEQKADKSELEKLNIPKNYIILIDQVSGVKYRIAVRDGSIVSYVHIEGITVTSAPAKTTYMAGEYFDSTGLVISTVSSDGNTVEVSEFIVDEIYANTYLTEDVTEIGISYTDESGEVYTTTVPITVTPFDPAVVLVDFEYTANDDGTYTITGWKETLNGESSTEMIIPNNGLIIV